VSEFTVRNGQSKVADEKPRKGAFSLNEFVQYSNLGRDFLYQAIRQGKLKARKAGRRTIILTEDGDTFLSNLPTFPL
jgi:hypothetical protein